MHNDKSSLEWLQPILSLAIALAALLAGRARADETAPMDLRLTFANGFGAHRESGEGMASLSALDADAELSTLLRWHDLAGGGLIHADTATSGYYGLSFGGQLGLAHRDESGIRYELLGVGGVHLLNSLGAHDQSLFGGGTSGYSATLPFLGLRAGLYKVFSPESDNHFTLGLVGLLDFDLGAARGQTTTSDSCFLGCGTQASTTAEVSASTTRYVLMISLGWTHDFAGGPPARSH